jgi:hypothetical protein
MKKPKFKPGDIVEIVWKGCQGYFLGKRGVIICRHTNMDKSDKIVRYKIKWDTLSESVAIWRETSLDFWISGIEKSDKAAAVKLLNL